MGVKLISDRNRVKIPAKIKFCNDSNSNTEVFPDLAHPYPMVATL